MGDFADRLYDKIASTKSSVCVGLDPKWERIPAHIRKKHTNKSGTSLKNIAGAILEFNQRIIDAVADIVPAVKPQIAYYELAGHHGIKAFRETCAYAKKKGLIVIGDVKRGDISTTAAAYAQAYLGGPVIDSKKHRPFDIDAITVNPYFGTDGIRPFIEQACDNERGIFILLRTSNPSSEEIQNVTTHTGTPFYKHIAQLVEQWSVGTHGKYNYSSVGVVVGATHPREAKELRKLLPWNFFLVPGYGAQGAGAKDIEPCFNDDATGALVNASRSIIYAYDSEEWRSHYGEKRFEEAARKATLKMTKDITSLWK